MEATIQLIGGKYKAVILWHLMNQTLRYSELHRLMPRATDKMLAQQLRELEGDGLIDRKVYPGGAAKDRVFSYGFWEKPGSDSG